jgi:Raf kinase inhibitor-like YbhB/YbcL family protein
MCKPFAGIISGLLLTCIAMGGAQAAEPFRITSPTFKDGDVLPKKFGGISPTNKNCIGENVSIPLQWTPGPEGTKSYVLMMVDLAGRMGSGVDHWLAYGIPANITKLDEGAHSKAQDFITGGTAGNDTQLYFGPCPAPGTGIHHYVITLVATDLAPGELKPGLKRDEIIKAMAGRGKAVTDMVLRQEYLP